MKDQLPNLPLPQKKEAKPKSSEKETVKIEQSKPEQKCIDPVIKFMQDVVKIIKGKKPLSYSSGSKFLSSPSDYKRAKTGKQEQTKAMIEGQQFHMATLEAQKFDDSFFVLDDEEIITQLKEEGFKSPRSSGDYKKWKINQELENSGKELIEKEWYDTLKSMEDALIKNSSAGILMKYLLEKEELFNFTRDDFKFTGKIDGYGIIPEGIPGFDAGEYTLDLKKAADARLKKVRCEIKDKNYDFQGALYSEAKGTKRHFLIFIDKELHVTVIQLSEDNMAEGDAKIDQLLDGFTECYENNQWDASYEFWRGPFVII